MVMFDSLNRRFLPPYGCDWVKAPNFERLAEHTVTFDNCYIGSMATIPARRELHTGRYNFLHRSWGPLEPFDDSAPRILGENGIHTHLISDNYHYWDEGGATYHKQYGTWEMVRGQEGEQWKGEVANPEIPNSIQRMGHKMWRQDWINRKYMRCEEDQPQAVTFAGGLEFLRTNGAEQDWFLQLETFDPHEPFFSQTKYKELYPHDYEGPHFDWPPYAPVSETEEQVRHVRYEYAALVSMCDHYLGKVLDLMDEQEMWRDTMLIVNTDHGYLLGEHDWWAKMMMPWYNELSRIPLFIWDPRSGQRGERRGSLVQTIDLGPTLLDLFGCEIPQESLGRPLGDAVADGRPVREAGLFGMHGGHVNITDGRFVYMRSAANPDNAPLYDYTLMPAHMRSLFSVQELEHVELAEPFPFTKGCRTMRIPAFTFINPYEIGTLLFDLESDPCQENPLIDHEVELRMVRLMVDLMRANDAPAEQYERLGLPADGQVTENHLQLGRKPQEAPPEPMPDNFDRNTKIRLLLTSDAAREVLERHLPGFSSSPRIGTARNFSLHQISGFIPQLLPRKKLEALECDLRQLKP